MEEENKASEQQEQENQEIEVSTEVYEAIESEISAKYQSKVDTFNTTLSEKDKEIENLRKQLQVANRTRTIKITNTPKEEPKQEEPKNIFI